MTTTVIVPIPIGIDMENNAVQEQVQLKGVVSLHFSDHDNIE